jgi:hypothetical protein
MARIGSRLHPPDYSIVRVVSFIQLGARASADDSSITIPPDKDCCQGVAGTTLLQLEAYPGISAISKTVFDVNDTHFVRFRTFW